MSLSAVKEGHEITARWGSRDGRQEASQRRLWHGTRPRNGRDRGPGRCRDAKKGCIIMQTPKGDRPGGDSSKNGEGHAGDLNNGSGSLGGTTDSVSMAAASKTGAVAVEGGTQEFEQSQADPSSPQQTRSAGASPAPRAVPSSRGQSPARQRVPSKLPQPAPAF